MKIFGVAVFNPGNDENTFPYPYRGSIYCKDKYVTGKPCPFRIPVSWWSKHKHLMVNSGNLESRKLCITHNHAIYGMELDGCKYIISQLDLKKYEVSSIHTFGDH